VKHFRTTTAAAAFAALIAGPALAQTVETGQTSEWQYAEAIDPPNCQFSNPTLGAMEFVDRSGAGDWAFSTIAAETTAGAPSTIDVTTTSISEITVDDPNIVTAISGPGANLNFSAGLLNDTAISGASNGTVFSGTNLGSTSIDTPDFGSDTFTAEIGGYVTSGSWSASSTQPGTVYQVSWGLTCIETVSP